MSDFIFNIAAFILNVFSDKLASFFSSPICLNNYFQEYYLQLQYYLTTKLEGRFLIIILKND